MKDLLLEFCSLMWDQVFWYFQHYFFFCSGMLQLFGDFCALIWTLGLFYFCAECDRDFDWESWSTADLWTWVVFPPLSVIFNFFLQCFIAFIVEVSHLLSFVYFYVFYTPWSSRFPSRDARVVQHVQINKHNRTHI
jgi:hypothetical protein